MAIQQSVSLQYLVVTPVGRFTFTVTRDQYGYVSIGNVRRNGVTWNGTYPVEVNTAMQVAVDEVGTIDGSNPVGYLIASNYLSEFADEGAQAQANARANLGLSSTATTALTSLLLKANNLSEIATAGAVAQASARSNLGLGSASIADTTDFLSSTASIDDLSDVDLGGALVNGKILKVVDGVITQADPAGGGGGFTQEEIEDFVGAMFVNGGGVTWTYDDDNSEISAVVSIASTDLSNSANIPLLNANQTFTGNTRATTQPLADNSTLLATTAFVQQEITALNLGSASQADTGDFLPSNASIDDLSDVNLGGALVNGKILKVVGGVITQADEAGGGGGFTQEEIEDFVGAMFVNGGGVTWTYDDDNSEISAVVTLASTNLSDTANLARLDANQTFTGNTRVSNQPLADNSSLVANTAFVQQEINALNLGSASQADTGDFLASNASIDDLSDVNLGGALINGKVLKVVGGVLTQADEAGGLDAEQVQDLVGGMLVDGGGVTWTYDDDNAQISAVVSLASTDLSNSANIALLDANQTFTGSVRATTQPLADNSTLLASTAFVQQEITALNLGTASQADTGDFLASNASIDDLSDVDLGGVLVNGKVLKVVGGVITQADDLEGLDAEQVQDLVGAMFTDNQAGNSGITFTYDDDNALLNASVSLSLDDLSDVQVNLPLAGHVLVHNGLGQFTNRELSSTDLSNSADLALLDSPVFVGVPEAPTAPLGTNTAQLATTEFVQQEITALDLADTYQPLNARLTDLSIIAPTAGNFIVGDGANLVSQDPSQVRTTLNLDGLYQPLDATLSSIATLGTGADKIIYSVGVDTWAESDITAFGRSLIDDTDVATARATLELEPGVDVQAFNLNLNSISTLGTGADKLIYTTGVNTWAEANLTTFARSLLDDADAPAVRTTLGLGSASLSNTTDFLASSAGLDDLSDVQVNLPLVGHVLVHNGLGQFTNRLLASTDLSNTANIALLDANQTFTGSVRVTTQPLADSSTLIATTAFVQQEITALNLGTASQADTGDFLSSSLITLAGVPGGVPLVDGQTLVYDLANNTFRNKSLSSLDLSDTANIARLNANQTFTGNVDFFGGDITADTPDLTAVGREVATASFVRSLIAGAGGVTQLDDLTDVKITGPLVGQTLKYTGVANGFENASLSSSDLSDVGDLLTTSSSIDDLSDVDTTTTPPALGQVLTWSAGNLWTAQNAPSTYTDNQAIDAVGVALEASAHTGISFDHDPLNHTISASVSLSIGDLSDVDLGALEEFQVLVQDNTGNFVNRVLSTSDLSNGDLVVLSDVAGDVEITGDLSIIGAITSTAQGHTLADISISDGSITSLSAAINFGANNLTTTGTITTQNLVVNGTTTTINTESLSVTEPIIRLANGADADPNASTDTGFIFTRGSTEDPAAFYWDEGVNEYFLTTAPNANDDTIDFSPLNPTLQPLNLSTLKASTSALIGVGDPAQLTLSAGSILSANNTITFGASALSTTGTISALTPPSAEDSSLVATTEWVRDLSINALSDVDTTDPSVAGQVLAWNGTNWVRSSALSDAQLELDNTQSGAGLDTDGSYLVPVGTNYLGATTSLSNADATLDGAIKGVSDNLDAEILRATGVEGDLQLELDDTQEGAGLDTDGSYITPVGSNYLGATTSLSNADFALDGAIKGVSDNLDAEILRATGVEGDLQLELDNTQGGAGLNANGTYTADGASNYIRLATSLFNADSLLDTEIKALDTALLNEINRATDVEGDIQLELDNTQTSLGLNADGSLPDYTSNFYLPNGTSHHEALSLLDTAVNNATGGALAELDATQEGAGLDTDGSYIVPVGSNYLDLTTSLASADLALDISLGNTSDLLDTSLSSLGLNVDASRPVYTATNYITDLQSHHDAIGTLDQSIFDVATSLSNTQTDVGNISTQLSNVVTGAGLDGDGTYAPPLASNYINIATSLFNADTILDGQIKSVSDNLDAEILRATGVEGGLQLELDNTQLSVGVGVDGSLPVYSSTHFINDTESHHTSLGNLDNALFGLETNLNNLTSDLQDELDDTQLGAGLGVDGTYTAPVGSNYLAGATSLFSADSLLDTEIKNLSDTFTDIQNEIDDTQLGAGLDTDGSYITPVGSNYLGATTSLSNADFVLDGQIKSVVDGLGTASSYDVGTADGQIPVLGATGLPAVSGVNLTALGSIGLHSDVDLTGIEDGNTIIWDETANGGLGGFIISTPDGGLTADQVRSLVTTALDNGTHTGVTSLDFSYDDLNNTISVALSIQTSDLTDVDSAPTLDKQVLRYSTAGGLNKLVPTLLGTASDYDVGTSPNEILLLSEPTQQNVNAVADLIVLGRVIETIDYGQVSSVFMPGVDFSTDWNGTGFSDVVVYAQEDYGVLVS